MTKNSAHDPKRLYRELTNNSLRFAAAFSSSACNSRRTQATSTVLVPGVSYSISVSASCPCWRALHCSDCTYPPGIPCLSLDQGVGSILTHDRLTLNLLRQDGGPVWYCLASQEVALMSSVGVSGAQFGLVSRWFNLCLRVLGLKQ